jgi:hypothetical protein
MEKGMYKVLMSLAIAVAGATPAAADKIPKEMHGTWCGTFFQTPKQGAKGFPFGDERQDFVGMSCASTEEPGVELVIDAQGFETGDMRCQAIKVEKFYLNNYRKGILNPWGPAYRVKFRCEDKGLKTTTKTWAWQEQKGYIVMDMEDRLRRQYESPAVSLPK